MVDGEYWKLIAVYGYIHSFVVSTSYTGVTYGGCYVLRTYKIQAGFMICTGENPVTYSGVRYGVYSVRSTPYRGPESIGRGDHVEKIFGSWISSNEDVERNSTIQG